MTSRYLVWATGDDALTAIGAARLQDVQAEEYRSTVIEDTGLEIVGFRLGASERDSWFLPIDDGVDGREFRAQLHGAIGSASGRP